MGLKHSVRPLVRIAVMAVGLGLGVPDQAVFRTATDSVPIYATVRSSDGRLVTDLSQERFRVTVNGKPIEIKSFSNALQPITGVFLIDVSESMQERMLWSRSVVGHFVDALHPQDRLRLGSFGTEVAISPHLTTDRGLLHRLLREELWPGGGTPLWEALRAATSSILAESEPRTILILSDGAAGNPGLAGTTARADLISGGGMVYGLSRQGAGLGFLRSLANDTGGGYLELAADADLKAVMSDVANEVRMRYLMAFTPPVADGRLHNVRVEVDLPGARVQARRQFVARQSR